MSLCSKYRSKFRTVFWPSHFGQQLDFASLFPVLGLVVVLGAYRHSVVCQAFLLIGVANFLLLPDAHIRQCSRVLGSMYEL